ncbi:TonB-dependent receptor [Asticcacaulis sp. EMRT-3]|uniref:TonB-dependent receptor n=1 Tax=Asticcacaulis sp. EMRT-3 TaxID=3040349 RepID=UPI0024AF2D1C|nr:TonB-dependent receptor [Asticcacaulis sp. EMRT-3]MDI7773918.1 TonB-dependent receptor [Asticcacaulis sp. EMRT-3]
MKSGSMRRARVLMSVSALAVAGGMALGAGAAQAQAADPATAKPAADNTVVVVTGFRKAYADAIRTKRDSIEITDSINSDGLGRFPDLNVGEAIQRIPGVQLNREADSRNATISLRGLPGTFARTTLNGGAFADPILSSASNTASTPLGAFNSDIFSSITVVKSPDASDIAGGLSGNVDLRIAPALSRKDGKFIKVSEEYDTLGSLSSPEMTIGINHHFSPDFAVFGTVAYKQEKFRRDSISVNTWGNALGPIQVGNQQKAGSNPVYDALIASLPAGVPAAIYYPSQVRQFSRYNAGHLLSGATGFEWRPNDNWKIGTTAFYTERNLDQGTNDLQYIQTDAGKGSNANLSATSKVDLITNIGTPYIVNTPNGPRAYINSFSASNVSTYDSSRSEPAKQSTWSITPNAEFKNDTWRFTGTATISRAEVLANQIELDVIENPYKNSTGGNGITADIFTGGNDLSNAVYTLNTPNASHVSPGGYPVASAANQATQAANALGDKFGSTGTNGHADNYLNALQFDGERFFAGDHFLSGLQFGARYEQDKYESTGSRNTSLGALTENITSDMVSPEPAAANFFGGNASGMNTNWYQANVAQMLAAITPIDPSRLAPQFALNPSSGVFITPYGLVNNYWDPNYWNNNFTNENDVTSVYLMAKFKSALFHIPVRGNLGVRYEDTQNTITALDCENCDKSLATAPAPVNHTMTTRTYKNHYDYALPSFIVAADLTDDLILRFAAYSTYVRPQPRDTVPISGVLSPEPTTDPVLGTYYASPTYTVSLGATNLKPYTSDSLDLSLEWYNRPGGLVALDVFQKKLKGYIGPITDTATLCPADGLVNGVDYGLGTLDISTDASSPNFGKCESSNTFVNSTGNTVHGLVKISGQTNLSPITVQGVEFNIQQNLDFLPGFWKNFGGAMNYAYTTISGTDSAGKPITLPSVSKDNVNLIGYYETKTFGIRLVYNYRGKYALAAGNSFVGDARTVKARSQLDASASYNINKQFAISFDAFNLTDATRAEYENDPSLPRRIDYDGKTYELTLRANF